MPLERKTCNGFFNADEMIEKMETNTSKVDFKLLYDLVEEYNHNCSVGETCLGFEDVIVMLEMSDIPMTDAVRKLGICAGVLYA